MPNNKKRGDIVASSRSRLGNEKVKTKLKPGTAHQREFTEMMKKLFGNLAVQLEVEPNVDTINNLLNKKDKKKLN